ncbi:MAG TPA: hypothetical protein VN081_07090, partial [Dongiaceae bacterium]|nr:hypothetical protein [Dongiaceae bacterium]
KATVKLKPHLWVGLIYRFDFMRKSFHKFKEFGLLLRFIKDSKMHKKMPPPVRATAKGDSGGFLVGGAAALAGAHVIPIDGVVQFLANNGTAGQLFYFRAKRWRHLAAFAPLINNPLGNPEGIAESSQAALLFNRFE